MAGDITLVLGVVIAAYLLGSIPSAYIVGRLLRGVDIREVGDGRLGMAFTYRRVGLLGAIILGVMDVSKGAAAVLLAQGLRLPLPAVLVAGLAVVFGHNWSVFLGFKGGKGALTTYGVLVTLMCWQFFIALALAGVLYFFTHKSGISTGVLFGLLSVLYWFTGGVVLLSILPLLISLPMVLKHIFMPKVGATAMATIENLGSKEG
jgi:glycerol-3-phosphate acyltransferase PlsY